MFASELVVAKVWYAARKARQCYALHFSATYIASSHQQLKASKAGRHDHDSCRLRIDKNICKRKMTKVQLTHVLQNRFQQRMAFGSLWHESLSIVNQCHTGHSPPFRNCKSLKYNFLPHSLDLLSFFTSQVAALHFGINKHQPSFQVINLK